MKITTDEYIKALNEAYMKGYREGFKDGSDQRPHPNVPYMPSNPIGNPILNPVITWDVEKYGKPYNTHLDDMYEKAPYWMNPNFKITPTCDTASTARVTPFSDEVNIS